MAQAGSPTGRRIGGGIAWMAAGNWTEQAVNLAVFVTLTRILGPEAFGLLAMAAAFVTLAEFLVRETFGDYLISRIDLAEDEIETVFWTLGALGLGLSLALAGLSGPISRLYGAPQVAGLLCALAPTATMIALTAVPVALMRRQMEFRMLAIRATSGVVLGGIVGIAMALSGAGLWALAGQRLVQVATNVALAWWAAPWRPRGRFAAAPLRAVLRFGTRLAALRAAELSATQLPSMLIGAQLGAVALGQFSIAWRLVELGSFLIVTPLRMVAMPAFAARRTTAAGAAPVLTDMLRLTGLVALPAFAGLSALAGPVLGLVTGPGWDAAAPVLAILSIYGGYLCLAKIEQAFCLGYARTGALAGIAWLETSAALALSSLGARQGLVPAAAGLVVAVILFWPLRLRLAGRMAHWPAWRLAALHLRPGLSAAAMAGCILAVVPRDAGPGALAVGVPLGVAVYGLAALLLMRDRLQLLRRSLRLIRRPPAPVTTAPAA